MITEISSLQHPLVKKWVKLRSEKEEREEEQSVLLTGEKMVADLSKKLVYRVLIFTEDRPDIRAEMRVKVSQEVLRKITGVASPDGIAAVAHMPKPASLLGERILILDRLADPGNLGTLLRSALALGWDGVLFTPNTVDPFNDKALRASKGALFSLPYDWGDGEAFVKKSGRHVYLADLEGIPLAEAKVQVPLALILSHEGSGPAAWAEKCAKKITIPMGCDVESLNVASSGAIFLYAMRAP